MDWRTKPSPWTADRDEQLVQLHAQGLTGGQIAERLGGGTSRNAVIARINRLRSAGETRLTRRSNVIVDRAQRRRMDADRLADAMVEGAPTLGAAALAVGLTFERAGDLWREIKRNLGSQAQ